jgi:hypothetical protein
MGARLPAQGVRRLSPLAQSLGFTVAFNFSEGHSRPINAVTGEPRLSVGGGAKFATGLGGGAAQFSGSASDYLDVAGAPFATSTCTYLWLESGVDATSPGQSLTQSRYNVNSGAETGSFQIRLQGPDIIVLQAQIAVTLKAVGVRDNTGRVNACAVSAAGNNGRHAIFVGGALVSTASPSSSYTHGYSVLGGGSDCPSSTIKTYQLLFAPRVISDEMLQLLTGNPDLLWMPQRRVLAKAPVPTGPTYTFALGAGGLAIAGSSTRLAAFRRMTATTTAYALTPAAAAFVAARRIVGAPATVALAGTDSGLKARRRLPGATSAVGLVTASAKLVAARRLGTQPGAFALTGGTATFVYTPAPGQPGATYTLTGGSGAFLCNPGTTRALFARRLRMSAGAFSATGMPAATVASRRIAAAAASFGVAGGVAVVRAARRLTASGGALGVTGKAARLAAARRLTASAGGFAAAGTDAAIKYTAIRTGVAIDATTLPAARRVQFGGGTRLVIFGGGTRVVVFDVPSIETASTMANAEKPYFKNGKWFVDKDPDEESYYVADVSQELADRATTITSVEVLVGGVTKLEGPSVQGSLIVVKLKGMDVSDGADNFWTARVTCANTERFDRTTWLNRVDN